MNVVLKTAKWSIAVEVEDTAKDMTVKDIIDRLDNGELHICAMRHVAGKHWERKWLYPNGDPMGRQAIRFNAPTNRIEVIEAQGIQGMIHSKLGTWRAKANAKGIAVPPEKKVKVPVIKEEDLEKVKEAIRGSGTVTINTMVKYIDGLKDLAEIGACYKMIRHFQTKGGK